MEKEEGDGREKMSWLEKFFKLAVILFVLINLLSGCSYILKDDKDLIKNTIERFYDTQYKAYLKMEYIDITPYLDMSRIQNQNKVTALKELTFRRKYTAEKGYGYVEKRRFPLEFKCF